MDTVTDKDNVTHAVTDTDAVAVNQTDTVTESVTDTVTVLDMDTVTDSVTHIDTLADTDTVSVNDSEVLRSTLRSERAKKGACTLYGLFLIALMQFIRAGRSLKPSQGNVL
jgi:hypothetical protein